MKVHFQGTLQYFQAVAPLVGAWIESKMKGIGIDECDVAPLVGAWIESEKEEKMLFELCSRSSCRSVD